MDKGVRQVEGGIYNTRGIIRTHSHILWPNEFTSDIPSDDK